MAQHSATPPRLFLLQGEGTSLVPGGFRFLHLPRKFCGKFLEAAQFVGEKIAATPAELLHILSSDSVADF